jgi:hypothetical protein
MTRAIPMSESDWSTRLTDYCEFLGLKWFHSGDSRRDSTAGWPDLVIVGRQIIYVELKRENGKVKSEQVEWLKALRDAGGEVHIWRPSDWSFAAKRLRVLAGRR